MRNLSFNLLVAVPVLSSLPAFAENVFDDSLYTPVVPEYRSLADLKWKLPQGASMSNGWLVVEQKPGPDGKCPSTVWAAMPLDLSSCSDRGVELRMTVAGENLGKPDPSYFGFKFMLQVGFEKGGTAYPAAAAPGTTFAPTELVLTTDFVGRTVKKATLFLGLQAIPGRVAFDLRTLRMRETPYPYPRVNAGHKATYTKEIRERSRRRFRGVMSPGRRMTEDDFKTLDAWGANLIRYQMSCLDPAIARKHPTLNADAEKVAFFREWIAVSLDHLEKDLIPWARKYGMMIVVDLHSTPGSKEGTGGIFTSDACAACFVDTWREIARRFKGCGDVIYGYDLVNEPNQRGLMKYDYWTIQKLAANAIRRVDPVTPILVESNGSDAPAPFDYLPPLTLDNVIYQVHMYLPFDFTHQGVGVMPKGFAYPDAKKGWNTACLEEAMKPVYDFAKRHDALVYVGEFSAINWAEGAGTWMRDVIDVFERHDTDWCFHAFREWPPWSVEHFNGWTPSEDNPRKRALLNGFGGKASKENIALVPRSRLEHDSYDWFERHERIKAEAKAIDPEIVFLGDSITHFWAGRHSLGGADAKANWKKHFGKWRTLNAGFGWDRIQNVLWRIDEGELDGLEPKAVVIMIGSNNIGGTGNCRAATAEEIAEGVRAVVDRVKGKLPRAKVILCNILPRGHQPTEIWRTKAMAANAILKTAYADGRDPSVIWLEPYAAFLDKDGLLDKSVMFDYTHPAEKGYDIWAAALVPALSQAGL